MENDITRMYSKAINVMANMLMKDLKEAFEEHNLKNPPEYIAQRTIERLKTVYPDFNWHYSKVNGIWHTIKI